MDGTDSTDGTDSSSSGSNNSSSIILIIIVVIVAPTVIRAQLGVTDPFLLRVCDGLVVLEDIEILVQVNHWRQGLVRGPQDERLIARIPVAVDLSVF
jgi:hypothetical protein